MEFSKLAMKLTDHAEKAGPEEDDLDSKTRSFVQKEGKEERGTTVCLFFMLSFARD